MSLFQKAKEEIQDNDTKVKIEICGITYNVLRMNADIDGQRSARNACNQWNKLYKDDGGKLVVREWLDVESTAVEMGDMMYEILILSCSITREQTNLMANSSTCNRLYEAWTG